MTEPTPREVATRLLLMFGEQENSNTLLHSQADELAASGQLQAALRLLWSSIEIAKRQNDDYVLGVGRFHMALAYFVAAAADEWDRAAELCEKAAQHFEQKKCVREQAIAALARGYIYEALCHAEYDRWTQGFHAYMAAYVLLRGNYEEYAEEARQSYARLGKKYTDLGLAVEAKANAQEAAGGGGDKAKAEAHTKTDDTPPSFSGANSSSQNSQEQTPPNGKPANNSAKDGSYVPPEGVHVSETPSPNVGADGNANANTQSPPPTNAPKNSTDPTNAPAPGHTKASHFPPGLVSVRAVLERGFSFWGWFAFAGVCVLLGLLFGLLALAFSVLYEREPLLVRYLALGLLLGAALFLIPFVILAGARQLWLRLPENQAAVIVERERVWSLTRRGIHFLIPFHQDLVAFIPTAARPYANFKRNVVQWDTRWLSAHIEATYRVCAPDVFWDRVLYNLQRQKSFWVPSPLKLKTVEGALDKHAETLIERSLILVTMNPELRELAANERVLNDKIRELLSREAPADGIEFQNIEFSIMLSMSAQAP